MHTCRFQHGTHCTTCNYTGTVSSWLDENKTARKLTNLLMRYSTVNDRYFYQVLFSIINTFSNSFSYFFRFTKAVTYNTVLIAHYYDSRKAKCTATFGYFGYTLYAHQAIFQFDLAGFYSFYV